ncbi:MAG: hypothetical protein Q7S34_04115 [bacterium]|nr:hypothetical protein [bacterium]
MANKDKNQLATKNDLKEFRDEVKDYMGVLHENFSDQVKVIAKQNSDINKTLKKMNGHFQIVDGRLDRLEIKTNVLIETVADIKVDTAMIREELGSKADKSEHKKLEHRVAVLESSA